MRILSGSRVFAATLAAWMPWVGIPVMAAVPDSVYLMAYNVFPDSGLNFAWSANRQTWKGIGHGHTFVKSDFGTWGGRKKRCTIRT